VQGARGVVMSDASPVAVVKTAASAKEVDTHLARMPHHSVVGDFLSNVATPEQVSLLSRLVDHLQTSGMPFVKGLLDAHPEIVDCAQEHGFCAAQPKCLKNGKYQVHFGNPDKEVSIMHEATPDKMPYSCNVPTFGRDPVPGDMKRCWMDCAKAALEVNRVEACPKDRAGMATHEHVWALIPSCTPRHSRGASAPVVGHAHACTAVATIAVLQSLEALEATGRCPPASARVSLVSVRARACNLRQLALMIIHAALLLVRATCTSVQPHADTAQARANSSSGPRRKSTKKRSAAFAATRKPRLA